MESQWQAVTDTGEALHFEMCKGGYFSDQEEYGLRVTGKTFQDGTPAPEAPVPIQCVKAGTRVMVCEKNIFDISTPTRCRYKTDGFALKIEDGRIYSGGRFAYYGGEGLSFPVQAGRSYTFSFDVGGSYICYNIYEHDGIGADKIIKNRVSLSSSDTDYNRKLTITITPAKSNLALFFWGDAVYGVYIENLQVEASSDATAYEPYISVGELTTPCDLRDGDVWWPMSGRVERHTAIKTFDGTESWYLSGDVGVYLGNMRPSPVYMLSIYGHHNWERGLICCNRFIGKNGLTGETNGFTIHSDVGFNWLGIQIGTLGLADSISKLKSWDEEGDPLTIWYKLQTPIIEQYAPQPIFAPPGTVSVLQKTTDLAGTLSATMLQRRT